MHQRIKSVLGEVEPFDETLFPPVTKPCEHEKVIGEVDDPWLRKTFALARMYSREQAQLKLDASFSASAEHDPRIAELDNIVDMLMEIFWHGVRYDLQDWIAPELGVRANWKIVKSEVHDKMKTALRNLFGQ
jgi:hypothetical protein